MKRKHLHFQFKVTRVAKDASEECVIEGYANTSTKDRVGDVVLPEAFTKSLAVYLSNPILLANHDWNDPCGVITDAEVTDKGLFIRARISDTRPDIKTMIREKVLRTFSIGYNEVDSDFDEGTKTKVIKELELLEISIVTVPANAEALFTEVGANLPKPAEREDPATDPQAGVEDAPKSAPQAKVKSAKELQEFILVVKDVCGGQLEAESLVAVCDYFNSNEEVMTKAELIAMLRAKSAAASVPAPAAAGAKAPDAAAAPAAEQPKPAEGDKPAGDMGKMIEALMAKMDAIAEAMAQLLEMEKKPAEAAPAAEPKPAEAPKAAEAPAGEKNAEEMSDEESQKALDELNAQIADLEDEDNK